MFSYIPMRAFGKRNAFQSVFFINHDLYIKLQLWQFFVYSNLCLHFRILHVQIHLLTENHFQKRQKTAFKIKMIFTFSNKCRNVWLHAWHFETENKFSIADSTFSCKTTTRGTKKEKNSSKPDLVFDLTMEYGISPLSMHLFFYPKHM